MTPRPDYNGPGSSFEDGTYEARDDLEREAAADAELAGFGMHDEGCATQWDKPYGPCDCGIESARTALPLWIARWRSERAARLDVEAERDQFKRWLTGTQEQSAWEVADIWKRFRAAEAERDEARRMARKLAKFCSYCGGFGEDRITVGAPCRACGSLRAAHHWLKEADQ